MSKNLSTSKTVNKVLFALITFSSIPLFWAVKEKKIEKLHRNNIKITF